VRKKASVAANAAKYAFGISIAYTLIPPVISLIEGLEVSGNAMAQRGVVGIAWFLIIFLGLFAKGILSKGDQDAGAEIPKYPKKLSKWNFVFIIAAPLALWSFFWQPIIDGALENRYWIGVVFWVSVMFISGRNIFSAINRKTSN